MNIEWDKDGHAVDAYGKKLYKRWAFFKFKGQERVGAVLISQSSDTELRVNLTELTTDVKTEDCESKSWEPLEVYVNIPMSDVIKVIDVKLEPQILNDTEWDYSPNSWRDSF